MNVIFLDCDGVLNHQFAKDKEYSQAERFGLAQDLVDNLKTIVDAVDNAQIVVSSSWRSFRIHEDVHKTVNWRCILEHMLGGKQGVVWGDLGMDNEFGKCYGAKGRAEDIKAWLNAHKDLGVSNFVIIDDECSELRKEFPNNVVDCDIKSCGGLTASKAKEAVWILTNFGNDKKMTDDIFVIGDCHFWHSNIIKYCNRPWWKKDENGMDVPDVEKMNDDMVKLWNSVITSDSQTVYVNGDFCFGNKAKVKEVFDRLNGRKRIVLGNHDRCKFKDYYDIGFDRVYDKPVILESFCILSHAPLQWVKDGDVYMNVYAHVHTQEMYKDFTSNLFCTSAERLGYKPIKFTEIFEKCKNYKETDNAKQD